MNFPSARPERVFGTLAGKLVGILLAVVMVAALLVIGLALHQSWKLEGTPLP